LTDDNILLETKEVLLKKLKTFSENIDVSGEKAISELEKAINSLEKLQKIGLEKEDSPIDNNLLEALSTSSVTLHPDSRSSIN